MVLEILTDTLAREGPRDKQKRMRERIVYAAFTGNAPHRSAC